MYVALSKAPYRPLHAFDKVSKNISCAMPLVYLIIAYLVRLVYGNHQKNTGLIAVWNKHACL